MKLLCALAVLCISFQAFACEPDTIYAQYGAAGNESIKVGAADENVSSEPAGTMASVQGLPDIPPATAVSASPPTTLTDMGRTIPDQSSAHAVYDKLGAAFQGGAGSLLGGGALTRGERLGFSLSRPFGSDDADLTGSISPRASANPTWATSESFSLSRIIMVYSMD